jgi:hypothetical protein
MSCPRCKGESVYTGKTWRYSAFEVKQMKCIVCRKGFREYFKEGKLSHTIPKKESGILF